ncbi:hypothetical protein [Nocardioides aquiterrae]|uniref:GAF domain-containing protein n=1 Tax=Nocardioides aquiterrae TaxID=203799 RepID=A0ABP4F567_9ACTN
MSELGPKPAEFRQELARLAASSLNIEERGAAILEQLGRVLSFDVGWLAVRDPERSRHVPVATTGSAAPLQDYFARPEADEEVDRLGLNRRRPPMLASESPIPLPELRSWADHLIPAGFQQGLAAGLFTPEGRLIGSLRLLSGDASRPNDADRRLAAAVTTAIATNLDRTKDIAETARMLHSASAGVVLTRGGDVLPLPGLDDARLLSPGSRVLAVAAEELAQSGPYISFLARTPDTQAEQLVRVVALDFSCQVLDHLSAAVLLCPPGDVRGLTTLDLRVLGHLVEGVSDVSALAAALGVPTPTVFDSLARSLTALGTADLTVAAVRAVSGGIRLPPGLVGEP